MSFYNPYKQGPDYAQGISGIRGNILQLVLGMLGMPGMGGGQSTPGMGQAIGQTQMPPTNMAGNAQAPWMRQGAAGAQMPGGQITGNVGQMAPQGGPMGMGGTMTPEQRQQLLAMLAEALGIR